MILNTTYTAQEMVDRCLLIREAQNVVGSALHYDMLAKFDELYTTYWSKDADVCLGVNNGYFKGAEAVRGYYAKKTANAAEVAKFVFEKWPDKYEDGTTLDDVYGAGYVKGNDFHSGIIEIAADNQSAKCMFQVQSANTNITPKGPLSYWNLSYLGVDLVWEDETFKIKNMLWVHDVDHPCAEPWTAPTKYPDLPEFAALKDITEPVPNVPMQVLAAYTPDRPYPKYPDMPVPYNTLAETFSYGI